MTATVSHQAVPNDPAQLTFSYTRNANGWVTAQIVEVPAAISEGPTEREARVNVLEALHDLTHEQTPVERIAFATQAALDVLPGELEELARRLREQFEDAIKNLGRARVRG